MPDGQRNQLQKAIYDRLVAVAGASALSISTIYDHVPQGQARPYIVIGDQDSGDWSSKTFDGFNVDVDIHVWMEKAGRKDVNDVIHELYTALHKQQDNLTLADYTVIQIYYVTDMVMVEGAGVGGDKLYHGVISFNVLIQDT